MSRDYAKRKTTRKKSKKPSRLLWLALLLLGGLFIVGLVAIGKYHKPIRKLTKINSEKKPLVVTPTIPADVTTTTTITTPKFDFYNILPQKKPGEIVVTYELAVATVKDFAAADNLKARLTLLGLVVSITPIHKQGIQKYQVSVGPYDNKDGALADQEKLTQNKIKSLLKKTSLI